MARAGTDITARPLNLADLLDGIAEGSVVLPDFQRDFEWSEAEVASLMATVMAGWPAGSLLLMRGAPTFFSTRPFEGVSRRNVDPAYVVLDGQQRLTALYNALRGGGGSVYAIDLQAVGDDTDLAERLEEAIRVYSPEEWESAPKFGESPHERLVPLTALTSAADYFEWRDLTVADIPDERRAQGLDELSRAYKIYLGTVNHYQFPAVILEHDLPSEAVARIFERINKGGLRLSTFDLLVARAYTTSWNLRDEWDRTRREADYVDMYLDEEGLPIIQGLAIRRSGDIRRPALLKLPADAIKDGWSPSAEAMDAALRFVSEAGFRHPQWLPYKTLVIPLSGLARDFELNDHRGLLESWLWARSLGMDYDVASSTKASSDYELLREILQDETDPEFFDVDPSILWRATRRQQAALWRTFLSLLLRRGACDPYTDVSLVPSPSEAGGAVVTSLFARPSQSDPRAPHLWVLSQLILKRGGQHRSRGRAPLAAILEGLAEKPGLAQALRTQFLDAGALPSAAGAPEHLMWHRLQLVAAYLDAEFPFLRVRPVESGPPA